MSEEDRKFFKSFRFGIAVGTLAAASVGVLFAVREGMDSNRAITVSAIFEFAMMVCGFALCGMLGSVVGAADPQRPFEAGCVVLIVLVLLSLAFPMAPFVQSLGPFGPLLRRGYIALLVGFTSSKTATVNLRE